MLEWLNQVTPPPRSEDFTVLVLAFRLGISLVLGCVVAGVYRWTTGKQAGQANCLLATLVMLTVLITMVTIVINNDVARAFSLVGALAIVRFRTLVEDTRDTAFVIFAVAVGMAVGADWKFLLVPLVGIPFATLAAYLFRPRGPLPADYTLVLRLGLGRDPEVLLRDLFSKHLQRVGLEGLATARQGASLDLTYTVRLQQENGALAFLADLSGIEGVQNVELRQR